ncbi:3'-5' exoribonuclease [Candidatus Woesearchaeota archaeon]|nr:3'-5' exoribonuclease [Candidatus Woesearchaeota archaeon]
MYTVIDVETTGLSKYFNHITEIAAVKINNGIITENYQTLVNPQVRIPSFITQLTGINNEMVKDAPTIKEVLPSFKHFLHDDVFVAHNATFDFGFLDHNLKLHHDQNILNHRLCTKKLANRLLPHLSRKRLQDLCQHFNINNVQAHRALGDAQATALVFSNMLNILHEKGISEVKDVLKFERTPRKV